MNLRVAALVMALGLLGGSACVGLAGGDDPLGEMSIEPLGGALQVLRDDELLEIADAADLRPGDLIETADGGARVRLEGQRNVWIGVDSRVLVVDTSTLEARTGSVLASAAEHTAVRVGGAVASSSNGVFRVDRRVATARAATYRGDMTLAAPGNPRTDVAALYQSSIVAGDIDPPKPYQVAMDDVWDGQWLEDVVALEDELERLSKGFSNQIKKTRVPVAHFRRLIDRPVGFMRPYVRAYAPADLFVAYAIAERASGPTARAFRDAFALHEDDGSWGVIAAIMEVEPKPLVAGLEKLFLDTGVVTDDAPKVRPAAVVSRAEPSDTASSRRPPAGAEQPPPRESEKQPPQQPEKPDDKPKDPDDPEEECEGTIDCAAQELPLPDVVKIDDVVKLN